VNPRAASGGGEWRRRAATVLAPRNLPALFRAFPAVTVDFWGFYFVIFELYLIYFEVLLFVLHVKKNV